MSSDDVNINLYVCTRAHCQTLLLVPCLRCLCRTEGFVTFLKSLHDEHLHDVTRAIFEAFPPAVRVVMGCVVMSIATSASKQIRATAVNANLWLQ